MYPSTRDEGGLGGDCDPGQRQGKEERGLEFSRTFEINPRTSEIERDHKRHRRRPDEVTGSRTVLFIV